LLPLPVSFFKVLPQKINRFHRFRFYIPASCFTKNASASGSSKRQMLPSSLPLPASFFKVLPLPQRFNRFRFHIPGNSRMNYITKYPKIVADVTYVHQFATLVV